jgi:hypothetical protein
MYKNLIFILLAVVFLGCASFGQPFNTALIDNIEPGLTTEGEVISMFGPPAATKKLDNGIQVYEYSYGKPYPFGLGTAYDYLQIQFFNGVVINKWKRLTFFG